jgi:hypothetical protein
MLEKLINTLLEKYKQQTEYFLCKTPLQMGNYKSKLNLDWVNNS